MHGVQPDPIAADILRKEPEHETFARLKIAPLGINSFLFLLELQEERASSLSLASRMVESLKFLPAQARLYKGSEPIQFFTIFQSFIIFKGGLSSEYKNYIAKELKMRHIKRMELHYPMFRVLDQIICKQYKLNRSHRL
ncbi:villin putative [Euphorbia peplus]|nr:villin putative [Euphorbia peplus]